MYEITELYFVMKSKTIILFSIIRVFAIFKKLIINILLNEDAQRHNK